MEEEEEKVEEEKEKVEEQKVCRDSERESRRLSIRELAELQDEEIMKA